MQNTKNDNTSRVYILIYIIVAVFCIFTFRLTYLQVFNSTILRSQAERNQTRSLRIPSYRSVIYDRNKSLTLAYNQRSIALTVISDNLPRTNTAERVQQFQEMARILDTTPEIICTTIREQYIDTHTPIIIQDNVSTDVINKFAERIDEFPGLYWENIPNRVYPYKESAFHLIGYTGLVNETEYQTHRDKEEYYLGSYIGKAGIEKQYDEIIRGKTGTLVRTVNVRGQVLQQEVAKEPIQGTPLVLTVDARLQQKAYDLLKEFTGAVVATHAHTGEVLALVSTPSIDPSIFHKPEDSREELRSLIFDTTHPFLNRVLQGRYPPASTFKLITMLSFLKDGVDPTKVLKTTGHYAIGNRVFRDWQNHGNVNGIEAIEVSANAYFYQHSLSVGRQEIFNMAREFGLTTPFRIDLPDENPGFLPNDQWFRQTHKRPWSDGDTANISIGQGDVLTTPLEINMMTSVIANKGIIYQPFVLKEMLDIRNKQTIWSHPVTPLKVVNVPDKHFEIVRDGMREVVVGRRGTANWLTRYNVIKVPIAGKTGTAQTGSRAANNGLFTAFGPYIEDKISPDTIVITVLLEKAGTGNAVRIAAELFNYYFEVLYPEKHPKNAG